MSHIKRGASIIVPDSLSVDARMPLEAARRQIRLSLALMKEGWDDRATWPPKRRADPCPACATSTTSRGCDKSQLVVILDQHEHQFFLPTCKLAVQSFLTTIDRKTNVLLGSPVSLSAHRAQPHYDIQCVQNYDTKRSILQPGAGRLRLPSRG